MGRPHKCPYCGESGKSTSKGIRKTKTLGNRMIRFCKACKRKFTPKNQKSSLEEGEEAAIDASSTTTKAGFIQEPAGPDAQPAVRT